ncbi:MAG TPA: hypothetical protein VIK35_12050 [Verrucomicrobiae bacterium]
MSVAEAVMEKLSALPPKKQEQVLHYVETLKPKARKAAKVDEPDPHPWIKVALSMNLDGPPDWSEKFEDYYNADLLERKLGKRKLG